MNAEIIAVGTELLLGDVINSNAAWLSKELAAIGVDVFRHTTVGDNPERIKKAVSQALERAEILIFTGGLGPTEDDLTVETIAGYFNMPLKADQQSIEHIRTMFQQRDILMPECNLKQAFKPEGAETLNNPVGTAPGILWDVSAMANQRAHIITFPGVPKEMRAMWPQAKAYIQQMQKSSNEEISVLTTRFLNFFGIGESSLVEHLKDLMKSESPTVAPYVSANGEVRIRLASKAPTESEALKVIQPVKDEILKRCLEWYIGDDEISLEASVGELLTRLGLSVSTAESCTGGLLSSRLTDVPGSSAYTMLNVVTYSNVQKSKILGVAESLLETQGAVCEAVARQMASGIKRISNCDIAISLTGIAGPEGGSEEKPVGLVYIGLCGINGETDAWRVTVNNRHSRSDIKFLFTQHALNYLRRYLLML